MSDAFLHRGAMRLITDEVENVMLGPSVPFLQGLALEGFTCDCRWKSVQRYHYFANLLFMRGNQFVSERERWTREWEVQCILPSISRTIHRTMGPWRR